MTLWHECERQLGEAREGLVAARAAAQEASAVAESLRSTLAAERRARAVSGVARAVTTAASETRLLLLLRSQRERLASQALELSEVRRAAAASQGRPELEAGWLVPPPRPPSQPEEEEACGEAEVEATREAAAHVEAEARRKMMERCRQDWLGAVAMAI